MRIKQGKSSTLSASKGSSHKKMQTVDVEPTKTIIAKSSWTKKELADVHVDPLMLCQFACSYCSSNAGMHIKMKMRTLEQAVQGVTGERFDPHNAANIVIRKRDFLTCLRQELRAMGRKPGRDKTLVYSQLTDGFSPVLLNDGTARATLELLLEHTEYRIRILTKNAVVGNRQWLEFFTAHTDRFLVGLSTGTLNNEFGERMEALTSRPESRIKALRKLQDAGVPTYGMLCPVFPQVVDTDELERLMDAIRPERCEHVWAEPFNERQNWQVVRDCFDEGSAGWNWMTRVYGEDDMAVWSRYAAELYVRIRDKATRDGWSEKLRYLLYESDITAEDVKLFGDCRGVLFQSRKGGNLSCNRD